MTRIPKRLAASAALVAVAAFGGVGCVHRTLEIRTEPPGADVILDSRHVGKTPVTVPFIYGGVHEIILLPPDVKRGEPKWRTKVVIYDTTNLAYDGPGLDYFTNLMPIPFSDSQTVDETFDVSPATRLFEGDPEAYLASLKERADVLRVRARDAQRDARPLTPEDVGAPSPPAAADSRPKGP